MAVTNLANDQAATVLSEIQSGDGLSLSAAGRMFPAHRGAGTVNPSTVFRWVTRGTQTPDGRVVRLEAIRTPGRWLTSRAALARFVTALTSAAEPDGSSPPSLTRSVAEYRKSAEHSARELERRGA
jgi:hypothetical protein